MTENPPNRPTRRETLRAGGAALATGLSALGAGCSGLPPLGSEVTYGTVDSPAADEPTYRHWLPAASALPDDSQNEDGYHVWSFVPDDRADGLSVWPSLPRSIITSMTDYVGVNLDEFDLVFMGNPGAVMLGEVDLDDVRVTLADTRYEPDGSYRGYDLYGRSDVPRVVGVRDDGVLFANGDTARGDLEAVVDARLGDAPRYVDRDDDFAALVDSAGLRRWTWLVPGGNGGTGGDDDFREDATGWATTFDYDDRGVYFVETLVFPPDADVTEARVKGDLRENGRALESSAVDVEVDGRVVTVEMHLTRERYLAEFANDSLATPHVTWGVTHDRDAERLTFHHEAGDSVPAENLVVNPFGEEPVSSFDGVGNAIDPGDDLTVSTTEWDDDASVRLVYESPDGHSKSTLFSYELP